MKTLFGSTMTRCAFVFTSASLACFAEMKMPVRTNAGLVSGIAGRDPAINLFEGIPYAEPPVGKLRWTAPSPARGWQEVLKADHFGDACSQEFPAGNFPKSEDCLYLNVWTPATTGRAGLPVMVWIHGGGFRVGSAREALYDGEELAKEGVVVVTLNYRLGVLGFLAHPELTKESAQHASGNYGLFDQLAALEWVHNNIAAFGGDPNKVTIFGQSAGAASVNSLVASPLSKGLFRAAISESGGLGRGLGRNDMPSLKESEEAGVTFAASVGARTLADLRAMPAEKLVKAPVASGTNVDGWFLPESLSLIFEQGKQNKVSMLIGSNSDEAQHMIRSALPADKYVEQAHKRHGRDAEEFLKLYPGDSDRSAAISQQRQIADSASLNAQRVAGMVARTGSKTFVYYFSYLDTGGYNSEPPTVGLVLGADHGAELPYVFGLLNHWSKPVPDSDRKLQDILMSYWTNFAKALNPNDAGLPIWKALDESQDAVMILDRNVGMQRHPRALQVGFLQAHRQD
jgi:para-nitrobenzyl esterase